MATGKTNARWFRLLVDQIDLSGDSRQLGQFGTVRQITPIEGWSDGVVHYSLGQVEHMLSGYQAVMNNTALTGSHIELSALEEYIVSLALGIKAAPAIGDPAFLSSFEQMNYKAEGSDAVLVSADFVKSLTDTDHEAAFGVVLAPGTAFTITNDGASVDNGASSAYGALAHLHIPVTDGGDWTLKVQDSANDADWADLITFSSDTSVIAAERGDVAGTVDRYTRFQATRTSGTFTGWCTLVRQGGFAVP